jgi:hypothetical protein
MAKNEVKVGVKVTDNGSLKETGKKAKKTGQDLEKAGKGAHSVDRRLKGAARASSNSTKNFSKMSQGISGGLVPAYATLAASIFAVSALFRGLEQAWDWKAQGEGLQFFAEQSGIAMTGLVANMRVATAGLLEFKDAAQSAQIGTAAGLTPDQLIELSRGALLASTALGRDLTDSFNRLVRGVTKAEPELLDELGIILRLDIATRRYAAAHGLVASKLTLSQRRAAVSNEVMQQLNDNFGEFSEKADSLANPFTRMQTAFSDLIRQLSEGLLPPLVAVAEFLSDNSEAAALLFAGFAMGILKSAFPALKTLGASLTQFGVNAKKNAETTKASFNQSAEAFKKSRKKMMISDKVAGKEFQKILKKMGIQEKFNNMKRVADQKRSLKMMLNAEKGKNAKVKALTSSELAHARMVYEAMVVAHQRSMGRIAAAANMAGAGITAGITLPAILATGALSGLGAVITKMAPALTALGSVAMAAFGIATLVFILKFLKDMWTTTKKQRDEARKAGKEWDAIKITLEQIQKIQQETLVKTTGTEYSIRKSINKELVKQYNLMQGLLKFKDLIDSFDDEDKSKMSKWFVSNTMGVSQVDPEGLKKILKNMITDRDVGLVRGGRAEGTAALVDKKQMRMVNKMMEAMNDPEGADKLLEIFEKFAPQLMGNREATLEWAKALVLLQDGVSGAGKGVFDFTDALKNYEENMDRFLEKYKPGRTDVALLALQSMLTGSMEAKGGSPYTELAGTKTERQLGLKSEVLTEEQGGGYSQNYEKKDSEERLRRAIMLFKVNQKSQRTLKGRVEGFKRLEQISKRINDSHSKYETLSFKIKGIEEQRKSFWLDIATNQTILAGIAGEADEAAKVTAAMELEAQMLKLDALNLQLDNLNEQSNVMYRLRDQTIEAFDSAGKNTLADVIMGKEGSFTNALKDIATSTLQAGANVMAEHLMAPITGAFKSLLGVESPEDKQKKIMDNHVDGMEDVLKAHIIAMGGNWEGKILGDGSDGAMEDIITPGLKELFEGDGGLGSIFKGMFDGLGLGGDTNWLSTIFGLFGAANGGLIRKYGSGTGPAGAKVVPGRGTGDTVPALLTPGELVIPRGKRVGGSYNTTINVNMEGASDVTTDDDTGEALGIVIQSAVTQEIQNQQLPGGLLSPIGG